MTGYLSGAIQKDAKQREWKQEIIAKLPDVAFIDPYNYTLADTYSEITPKNIELLKDFVRNIVIKDDLALINRADFMVVYVRKNARLFGTICEIFYAKYFCNIPVYMITELDYKDMNYWEIGLVDNIFFSIDDFVKFMKQE